MNLDELLVDPETREPLQRATDAQLAAIRAALVDGRARRADGGETPAELEGAYLSHGGRWAYPVVDGFPSFVVEERLVLDEPV